MINVINWKLFVSVLLCVYVAVFCWDRSFRYHRNAFAKEGQEILAVVQRFSHVMNNDMNTLPAGELMRIVHNAKIDAHPDVSAEEYLLLGQAYMAYLHAVRTEQFGLAQANQAGLSAIDALLAIKKHDWGNMKPKVDEIAAGVAAMPTLFESEEEEE